MPHVNDVDPILPERLRRTVEEMHGRLMDNLDYRTLTSACDLHFTLTGQRIILSRDGVGDSNSKSVAKPKQSIPEHPHSAGGDAPKKARRRRKKADDSKPLRVYRAVERYLSEHGDAHRADLLKFLVGEGLLGTEANPMQTLARLLSESDNRFVNRGRGVWGLPAAAIPSDLPAASPVKEQSEG